MPLLNPRFEHPGTYPGEAAHWTLVTHTSAELIAGFGPEPYQGWENFERWIELKLGFENGELIRFFFGPLAKGYENFNTGWDNEHYMFGLPSGQVVVGIFSGNPFENMRDGWLDWPYAWSWDDVSRVIGDFDGEPFESFERGWNGNESYAWIWEQVSSETALFDSVPYEDFESGWDEE